jgi:hypothetical protein
MSIHIERKLQIAILIATFVGCVAFLAHMPEAHSKTKTSKRIKIEAVDKDVTVGQLKARLAKHRLKAEIDQNRRSIVRRRRMVQRARQRIERRLSAGCKKVGKKFVCEASVRRNMKPFKYAHFNKKSGQYVKFEAIDKGVNVSKVEAEASKAKQRAKATQDQLLAICTSAPQSSYRTGCLIGYYSVIIMGRIYEYETQKILESK